MAGVAAVVALGRRLVGAVTGLVLGVTAYLELATIVLEYMGSAQSRSNKSTGAAK